MLSHQQCVLYSWALEAAALRGLVLLFQICCSKAQLLSILLAPLFERVLGLDRRPVRQIKKRTEAQIDTARHSIMLVCLKRIDTHTSVIQGQCMALVASVCCALQVPQPGSLQGWRSMPLCPQRTACR